MTKRRCRRWGLWLALALFCGVISGTGLRAFELGGGSCPAHLSFYPVEIESLIVDWTPPPLEIGDAAAFELPLTRTGRMRVVFHDLDSRLVFPHYLIVATPVSKLAKDEGIAEVKSVVLRRPGPDGLIAHDMDLEPGYEYGVEVYALSPYQDLRLSQKPDTEYATTLLSPLFFGAYQVTILFGCDVPTPVAQGCVITPKTENIEVETELPLRGRGANNAILVLDEEVNGDSGDRGLYFLDPQAFGPADFLKSDRSGQATHVELVIRRRTDSGGTGAVTAYRQRMSLEDRENWVNSSHYFCRAVVPGFGNPASRCFGPADASYADLQSNPEVFRTGYRFSFLLADGPYAFELVALQKKKDADTGEISYPAVSAPAILWADVRGSSTFAASPGEYLRLLQRIDEQYTPGDEDFEPSYWVNVLRPGFKDGEPLLHALDDLGVKLNSQLE